MKRMAYFFFVFMVSINCFAVPDAEIIENISSYQVKSNKLYYKNSRTMQINNRDGDQYAELAIPYSKSDKINIESAWIEDADGNIIRKIKNKDIVNRSYISNVSLYEDDFIKTCDMKHNVYPYRIVYSYSITYNQFLHIETFDYQRSQLPLTKGILSVEVPNDYQIKYKQYNINEPSIEENQETTTYRWNYSYQPVSETREVNESVNSFAAPSIDIVPINLDYGVAGSQATWNDFGNWIYNLNKGRDELPEDEKIRIDELIKGVDSNKEKAKILYKYLQDRNRYINVSINLGGLQTYPASYVVANRYGDCKALTNYMQAMLKYVGVESDYTLIYAGSKKRDLSPDFASQAFNHVILTVPFEQDTVYLECTSKNAPFGYLGTFTQGRQALLTSMTGARLIQTPPLTSGDVLCSRNIEIDLATSKLKIDAIERGDQYEESDYLVNEVSKNVVDKYIRNNLLKGSFDLIDFKIETIKDLPQTKLYAEYLMHNFHKKYGNNIVINSIPINISAYEMPEIRKKDVQIDYPEMYSDTIAYDMGAFEVKALPKNTLSISKYGTYIETYEQHGTKVIQYKTILVNEGRYPLEEYGDFYKFISMIKSFDLKKIYIEII